MKLTVNQAHSILVTAGLVLVLIVLVIFTCLMALWGRAVPTLLFGMTTTIIGILVPSPATGAIQSNSPDSGPTVVQNITGTTAQRSSRAR